MSKHTIALVLGDGAAPEMMEVAIAVAQAAAMKYGDRLDFIPTPAGWNAWEQYGDTMPESSLKQILEIGTVFFGGVGDPGLDNTIGAQHPKMKPEARCLLQLRKQMGLLLNYRPAVFHKAMKHLSPLHPRMIPDEGVMQIWIRFLLQDSYFGNSDFLSGEDESEFLAAKTLCAKLKDQVTGDEQIVTDLAYYSADMIGKYARAAFAEAQARKLPMISVDKSNVMARYMFWRMIVTKIGAEEFPDVPLQHLYSDATNALLVDPAKLNGVIMCGNEHGDVLSDGALAVVGGMGLMHSSAINPDSGFAMFESGAGTAPSLKGMDVANPLGRILTAGMMLRHLGMIDAADSIAGGVWRVLENGYVTADLRSENTRPDQIIGTKAMGEMVTASLL